MFNIIDLESGERVEELFTTGREAAAKAKIMTEETGRKHQPRKVVEDTAWQERERTRLLDGTYKPLPVSHATIALLDRAHPTHFLHMSDQPPFVAFTKDPQMGAADRQTRLAIEIYLERYFLVGLSLRREIIDAIDGAVAVEVKFAETPEEITRVYRNYDHSCNQVAQSCMRHSFDNLPCHPTSVYGAGDLAIAYLANNDNKTTHRTLCWPEKKVYSRMYAPDDKLHVALKSLGYLKSQYYDSMLPGSFEGAKLLKIDAERDDDVYVMPYIDERLNARASGKYFVLESGSGYNTHETCGMTEDCEEEEESHEDEFVCDCCSECALDDEATTVYTYQSGQRQRGEEMWCRYCRESRSFYCDGTQQYFACQSVNAIEMADSETWSQGYFDENGGICDHTGDNYPTDELKDVRLIDGSIEHWCESARTDDATFIDNEWRERDKPDPFLQTSLPLEQESAPCP